MQAGLEETGFRSKGCLRDEVARSDPSRPFERDVAIVTGPLTAAVSERVRAERSESSRSDARPTAQDPRPIGRSPLIEALESGRVRAEPSGLHGGAKEPPCAGRQGHTREPPCGASRKVEVGGTPVGRGGAAEDRPPRKIGYTGGRCSDMALAPTSSGDRSSGRTERGAPHGATRPAAGGARGQHDGAGGPAGMVGATPAAPHSKRAKPSKAGRIPTGGSAREPGGDNPRCRYRRGSSSRRRGMRYLSGTCLWHE